MSWVRESSLWQIAVDEGREEGRLEAARQLVLEFGAERLGPPDEAVRRTLDAISDHDELKRLLRNSFTATSWQELLADAPAAS